MKNVSTFGPSGFGTQVAQTTTGHYATRKAISSQDGPIFRAEKGSVKLSIPQFDVAVMLQSLAVTVRSFKMAHEKHKKTITAVPCGATDVVCSISAGRPTEIENSAGRPTEIENKIRLLAHDLYSARGREPGRDLEDWLRAEIKVLSA